MAKRVRKSHWRGRRTGSGGTKWTRVKQSARRVRT